MGPRIVFGLMVLLGVGSVALGKKAHPAETAPTTQESPKEKADGDVETHKARAKEFENGKDLDKADQQKKLDEMKGQVNDLDAKLKASKDEPAAVEEAPKRKRGGSRRLRRRLSLWLRMRLRRGRSRKEKSSRDGRTTN